MNWENNQPPEFNEEVLSKLPALQLLINMGYHYLTSKEAGTLRNNRMSQVILEGILVPWLREHNGIQYKNQTHPFSENNIINAVQALKDISFDGLVRTNEKIYDLLCVGKSMPQAIDGDTKSFTMRYIDWEHPENNHYHITEEFAVERTGSQKTYRPDIVLFVNGIPLVIIENKSPHIKDPISEAIKQHGRYWKDDGIPNLYLYSQLLLSACGTEAQYATTGTPEKFWSVWREKNLKDIDKKVSMLCNRPLSFETSEKIYSRWKTAPRDGLVRNQSEKREITAQDRLIHALCNPHRLLEIIYRFILYDAGVKKIARYQQYFCVKKIMKRVLSPDDRGRRRGGVVWHTQGSGKSLTMVFLAKAIALTDELTNYKIVLVTDRVDLDDQIYKTFKHCGKELEQSKTGKELSQMLREPKKRIITTIIDKFDAAVGRHVVRNDYTDIFVLVDEGHRGQYGPRHANMRRVLPNACYIGFTGTPVMKKDKNTVEKFGGLIDTYPIDKAVKDKAVVPLLYEGRHVDQKVDSESIDAWFDRITANLSREQAADLKKKFSTTDQLNKAAQKVMRIAWDIGEHFRDNWQNTIYKAQLVTQDKTTALLYKHYLDEFGMVSSEVLISAPEEPEGDENRYGEDKQKIQRFWKTMMQRYGSEKQYNKQIINAFKNAGHPEIIIVVDKLLTGFDAPRNTVLYLTRKLKDHTLLQAIARVNRLCEGKEFGFIIDYRGVLENLDHALDLYSTLPLFDAVDLDNILTDISTPIADLPQKHAVLWDTFKEVRNRRDVEEYHRVLWDDALRNRFYDRLSAFARVLAIALSSVRFLEETPPGKINRYRKDLKFFTKLRLSVKQRFAEVVDFGEYEPKIQKLLDTHVGTGEVEQITPLVNIFNKEAFALEVEKITGTAAKADTIAHRTQKAIREHMSEDPAFYKRFSQMLEETIRAFREERLNANQYLDRVNNISEAVINRTGDDIPKKLENRDVAKAYFGVIKDLLPPISASGPEADDIMATIALEVEKIIRKYRIVNWTDNIDIQNKMRNEMEDLIFNIKEQIDLEVDFDTIDDIMDRCIDIAKVRTP